MDGKSASSGALHQAPAGIAAARLGERPAPRQGPTPAREPYALLQYFDADVGIDLPYGTNTTPAYDFVLAPGTNPRGFKLVFAGIEWLEISGEGDLVLHVRGRTILDREPCFYQEIDGARRRIPGAYELNGTNSVGFRVPAYDKRRALVIHRRDWVEF